MNKIKQLLFEEKYRPIALTSMCLPERLKKSFELMIQKGDIPNLLLYGYTGTGKTTIARILVSQTNSEHLFINGSENRGIDILRTVITEFVTTVSLNGLPKVVIIDEADNLSPQTLAAMRGFIEEHIDNARFIFTAETIDKFPKAIVGRLKDIEFRFSDEENKKIKKVYFERIIGILKNEGVKVDKLEIKIIADFIKMYYPNLRKILVDIQKHLHLNNNKIDVNLLKPQSDKTFEELCKYLKTKDFNKLRHLIKNEINEDSYNYLKKLYNKVEDIFQDDSIPDSIIIIGEYMYRDNSVRSKEINFSACCMQLMKLKFRKNE